MKPSLLGDRASSAVPARSPSLARRFGAWARESLVARAIAVATGLVLLALIGGSALGAGKTPPAAEPTGALLQAPSPQPAGARSPLEIDAGAPPNTRPELLPRALAHAPSTAPDTAATDTATDRAADTSRGARSADAPSPRPRATPDDPVDLNAAGLDDLRRLPGIGAKRAEAILALRAHLPGGRFRQVEDLLKVKGIGRAMLKRLHPLIRLG